MTQVIHPDSRDTTLDVIAKLIPIEVVSIYTSANAYPDVEHSRYAAPSLFVLGLVLTPLVLFLSSRQNGHRPSVAQYLLRTLAFVAWAFAVGNPLAPHDPIERWIPAVAVLVIPILGAFVFPPSAQPMAAARRAPT